MPDAVTVVQTTPAVTRPVRILVAEDEHLVAADLAVSLRDLGYEVIGPASDGETALRLAQTEAPDLALLDIRMPRRDGLSVAREIFGEHGVPVVILSAYSDAEYVNTAQTIGVFGYVIKPATSGQLRASIDIAWSRHLHARSEQAESADLRRRLEERRVIEQAKWVLVQRKGITESEAMQTLQRHARASRRKMIDIARQLLDANEII